ncbi:hypothetical protein BJX99DRAFT_75993 [Aspergillus californicus]
MTLNLSHRRRRKATQACDLCQVRKRQCIFGDGASNCQRCARSNLECTFLKEPKVRGPRVLRSPNERLDLTCKIEAEYLCSVQTMHRILADFSRFVYPIFPLVHQPALQAGLEARAYRTDPGFLRRCISLCALTIASMPSNISEYGGRRYGSVQSMVDRACGLVSMSRLAEDPAWQDNPRPAEVINSVFLCMAANYAGRTNTGWSFCNVAMVSCNSLRLHREEGYTALSRVDAELCKRAFWVLYTFQCFDRFVSVAPHVVLDFPPGDAKWEYLELSEIPDERLVQAPQQTPLIAGFLGYIALFQCLRRILAGDVPVSCQQAYELFPGKSMLDHHRESSIDPYEGIPLPLTTRLLAIREMMSDFQSSIQQLPPELRFPISVGAGSPLPGLLASQFDMARANIHITSLYIQSVIVENIIHVQLLPAVRAASTASSSPITSTPTPKPTRHQDDEEPRLSPVDLETLIKRELWRLRGMITQRLLDVIDQTSKQTLEGNSFAFVTAIRKTAATLLDPDGDLSIPDYMKDSVMSESYVQRFAEILGRLDCNAPVSLG